MTGSIATPRYSAEDFDTASIHSAAPSYVSDVPSYHTVAPYPEAVPPYTPPVNRPAASASTTSLIPPSTGNSHQRTIGLPPVPSGPVRNVPNLNNFSVGNWPSVANNPTNRQYQRVAQRRINAQRDPMDNLRRAMSTVSIVEEPQERRQPSRHLEDPYLVGETAAARARQERIAREQGNDILVEEDRQWDWFLAQMRDWDERDRSWARFRREAEMSSRKKLLRRIGGRRLMM
ncbi:hypothetical protein BGZ63DRAFT_401476 [Mariannaea sp. PMI_226]|nr:hypothetical protein BGZ63DRAFT_401476 [Mariannaea sp. PMI_226]